MTGTLQPLDSKFAVVDKFGNPTEYFTRWAQQRQIDIGNSIQLSDVQEYLTAHKFASGQGISLTPNGDLNNSPSISVLNGTGLDFDAMHNLKLADTTVTPGTYGDATHVPAIVVDQQGRITGVTLIAISGGGGGGAWTKISTLTAAGTSPTFDFTAIPGTFQHLKLIGQGRTAKAATTDEMVISLNGDAVAANYQSQQLQGNAGSATAAQNPAVNNHFGSFAAATATANQAGMIEMLFPQYAGTTFIKEWAGMNSLPGFPLVKDLTGRWNVTTAINRITITAAANFVAGSAFTLYGIS